MQDHDDHIDLSPVPIIAMDQCRLQLDESERETFTVDLEIMPGDKVAVMTGDEAHERALLDALRGLSPPLEGAVRFLGRDWRDLSEEVASACRGRISSTLSPNDWLPYRSVLENVLLPHLYHSRRPVDDIAQEAAHWAQRFGLPGIPGDFPNDLPPKDRQVASLVRAFVGVPLVIIIEHQDTAFPPALECELVNAVSEARQRGAAVLRLTRDLAHIGSPLTTANKRLRLVGRHLRKMEAA